MTKQQEFRKQTEEAKFEAFSLMCKKVAELEKENAELKEQLNFKTRYVKGEKAIDQLAQAKEIIKELLLLPYANNEEVYADVTSTLDKAEQFLEEIENE